VNNTFYVIYLADKTVSASLPRLPANDDFDRPTSPRVRFKELAQVWRSLIHCCWTVSVEQPTSPSMWLWTYSPGVPPVTEDALVLLRTAAPILVTVLFERLINLHLHLHYIKLTLFLAVSRTLISLCKPSNDISRPSYFQHSIYQRVWGFLQKRAI